MTQKEKEELLKGLNSKMTDAELYNVIDGIFEKVTQTAVQPLSLVPNSDWVGWADFVRDYRIQEKLHKVLVNMITQNTSALMVLPSETVGDKVDVFVPVSTGQMMADRGQKNLIQTIHVIADQNSLIYGAPAGTSMVSFLSKGGQIFHQHNAITATARGEYNYKEAMTSFEPYPNKTIPVVWFTDTWLSAEQRSKIASTKKLAFGILKEVISQLQLAGPNLLFVGSSNNVTTEATEAKGAVLKEGSRVNTIHESLNRTVNNPIISFNNQPWFKEFWELIESLLNTLIEGLQVGDMNQGGKGTANMHTTEVTASFGVKAQKIINTQNMFLSSWALFAKILKENGLGIPAKVKFTYDSPENILVQNAKPEPTTPEPVVEDPSSEGAK